MFSMRMIPHAGIGFFGGGAPRITHAACAPMLGKSSFSPFQTMCATAPGFVQIESPLVS